MTSTALERELYENTCDHETRDPQEAYGSLVFEPAVVHRIAEISEVGDDEDDFYRQNNAFLVMVPKRADGRLTDGDTSCKATVDAFNDVIVSRLQKTTRAFS